MFAIRALFQKLFLALRRFFALERGNYLCDSCKWDWGNVCKRPERPNAKTCPDYKRK